MKTSDRFTHRHGLAFLLLELLAFLLCGPLRAQPWNGYATQGPDAQVSALVAAPLSGQVYAGGAFRTFQGSFQYPGVARWNGSTFVGLGAGLAGTVQALLPASTGSYSLYAAGTFPGQVAGWNGTAWTTLPGLGGTVVALAEFQGSLYAGGTFSVVQTGQTTITNLARWSGTRWVALNSAALSGPVYCLLATTQGLLVGGQFTTAGSTSLPYLGRWSGSAWSAVSSTPFDDAVRALTLFQGRVVAGGSFSLPGGKVAVGDLAPAPVAFASLTTGLGSSAVRALSPVSPNRLAIGGDFVVAPLNRLTIFENSGAGTAGTNSTVSGGVSGGSVLALCAIPNGTGTTLFVGGGFTAVGTPSPMASRGFASYALTAPVVSAVGGSRKAAEGLVYPNPAEGGESTYLDRAREGSEVRFWDLAGRLRATRTVQRGGRVVADLPQGSYLIQGPGGRPQWLQVR